MKLEVLVDVDGHADRVPLLDLADGVVGEAAGRRRRSRRGRGGGRFVGQRRRRRGGFGPGATARRSDAVPAAATVLASLRLVERLADLGRHQRRRHRDARARSPAPRANCFSPSSRFLNPSMITTPMWTWVRAATGCCASPDVCAEIERLLEDLARLLELALVDGAQRLAVQLRDLAGRIRRLRQPAAATPPPRRDTARSPTPIRATRNERPTCVESVFARRHAAAQARRRRQNRGAAKTQLGAAQAGGEGRPPGRHLVVTVPHARLMAGGLITAPAEEIDPQRQAAAPSRNRAAPRP